VWCKVQDVGLASAYRERDAVHRYIRRLISLPYLPADDIMKAFKEIKQRAQSSRLLKLVSYPLYKILHIDLLANTAFVY